MRQVSGVALRGLYRGDLGGACLLRRWWDRLRDTQAWLDVAHGMLVLPVTVVTWSVAVTWWGGAVGGLTYWGGVGRCPRTDPPRP